MTRHAKGFTLVELMLAIAFIGFVIIFTVLAIVQVMRTYNKGLTVKEINQTSRSTLEDMARVIRGTDTIITSAIGNGRLCLGGVSYVWNIQGQTTNRYDSPSNPPVTLVRVDDQGGSMCTSSAGTYPNVPAANATQLLTSKVWVQMVDVSVNSSNDIATLTLQLSTSDDPTHITLIDPLPATPPVASDPTTWVRCSGIAGSEFCSVVTFTTSVAMRGSE